MLFVVHCLISPSLPCAVTVYDTAPGLWSQLTAAVLLSQTREALIFMGAQGADGKTKRETPLSLHVKAATSILKEIPDLQILPDIIL